MLLHRSIADVVEEHVRDERLRALLHGQGVIGTWAGPRDPGTAAVHALHAMGTLADGRWGYVRGGTGRVSFALADAAREHGAVLASGVEVAAIESGVGVRLAGGELIRAAVVVSNADPRRTTGSAPADVPDGLARAGGRLALHQPGPEDQLRAVAAAAVPGGRRTRPAAPRDGDDHLRDRRHPDRLRAARSRPAGAVVGGGVLPVGLRPDGRTTRQPCDERVRPVRAVLAGRRHLGHAAATEIADAALAEVARFAPDVFDCVVEREVLGPPDVEARIGLTGGHIFQGDCLPDQMWDRRFAPRTGVPALYLCGAATHPGGSVIGVNGRNAADAVLADTAP